MTDAALLGKEIFNRTDVGCSSCHAAPNFTDSDLKTIPFALHDVGTLTKASGSRLGGPLTGLDTPTLKGIWATPPYLHDGSARTLEEVLTSKNPKDAHGKTSGLSAEERGRLIAYLLQLDETDAMGKPSLGTASKTVRFQPEPKIVMMKNRILILGPGLGLVSIRVYRLSGEEIAFKALPRADRMDLPAPAGLTPGAYLVRLQGRKRVWLKKSIVD
jgi:hypothetical protein